MLISYGCFAETFVAEKVIKCAKMLNGRHWVRKTHMRFWFTWTSEIEAKYIAIKDTTYYALKIYHYKVTKIIKESVYKYFSNNLPLNYKYVVLVNL